MFSSVGMENEQADKQQIPSLKIKFSQYSASSWHQLISPPRNLPIFRNTTACPSREACPCQMLHAWGLIFHPSRYSIETLLFFVTGLACLTQTKTSFGLQPTCAYDHQPLNQIRDLMDRSIRVWTPDANTRIEKRRRHLWSLGI
ncbi:hypothetical protein FOPG_05006 [Fusarium oxysporum f. sp. conglutinans race 2 54008]|uniref:Uncharacterized protein n=1 Tax=Fusarium oxysporum f. sp. conglutinans race 2 54008 TaxID=1089457 RepID=X0JAD6_FUSOX|nr:hypothetical protein FOPG_05006 [Fusarium oxysporum f. sp. conglutinans race 2 54008]EXL82073.1 hypothetical protein FOPG_05006 [Fusarium oxysporum f. sp. conglutinans race 2 54008]EXL82074.1 hypothetical protein FOPG_05006 [Fusarium oxysporum f. sp. conglutinans race 2 54008]EXL82075.1 hypothetical protein FOPG_05006 [Fusarium oxysporum f. sp. conglutinans race 2 54008]EXL82076.1 hypothetical protein FOPG_05006 [Fusarium oxysporum f. sp. conglutinans race 2 54008]